MSCFIYGWDRYHVYPRVRGGYYLHDFDEDDTYTNIKVLFRSNRVYL